MTRRSVLISLVTAAACLGSGGGLLYALVRYEKAWYRAAAVEPGPRRAERSREFSTEFCELMNALGADRDWYVRFTGEQVNSYLAEGFVQSGLDVRVLPEGIGQPRVALENNLLRLGFRYGSGAWSTVVTVEMRPWLPGGEPNALALELVGLYAGAVPVKAQSLLERIAQACRDNGVEVSWYRYNGHPVAILRFQPEQARPTLELQRIELTPGGLFVQGRVPESVGRTAGPAAAALAPAAPE